MHRFLIIAVVLFQVLFAMRYTGLRLLISHCFTFQEVPSGNLT